MAFFGHEWYERSEHVEYHSISEMSEEDDVVPAVHLI